MPKKKGPKPGLSYKVPRPYTFGQKLYTLRVRKGITQKELAGRLNTTLRAISYYEREASNPTLEIMKQVAEVLGVPVKYFLDVKSVPPGPGMPEVIRSLRQRLPRLPTLTRKEQENLVGVIDGFLAKHAHRTP